jgi:L-iditol 2-dehydrogenase
MKALMKTMPGEGHVEIVDTVEPQVSAGHVKIEVKFCGICGTDVHIIHDTFKNSPPVIIGHEFSGIVCEVGDNVSDVQVGDRVAALGSNAVVCGKCIYCKQGQYMFCAERKGAGLAVDGGFTKYAVVREDQVYKLPEGVSLEVGSLLEPFANAVQAIEELTKFSAGDVVLLSGPGPIGLLCLSLISRHGCKVIVAGTTDDQNRFEIAKKLGADVIVDILKEDLDSILQAETKGMGADIVVDTSGSPAAITNNLNYVKKIGTYIQVGITGREFSVNWDTILYKKLQVFGSLGHSLKTWDRAVRILEQGKIDISPVASHSLPLSQWQEGFDLFTSKKGAKVLLYPDED